MEIAFCKRLYLKGSSSIFVTIWCHHESAAEHWWLPGAVQLVHKSCIKFSIILLFTVLLFHTVLLQLCANKLPTPEYLTTTNVILMTRSVQVQGLLTGSFGDTAILFFCKITNGKMQILLTGHYKFNLHQSSKSTHNTLPKPQNEQTTKNLFVTSTLKISWAFREQTFKLTDIARILDYKWMSNTIQLVLVSSMCLSLLEMGDDILLL